jgi:hypothetical protein
VVLRLACNRVISVSFERRQKLKMNTANRKIIEVAGKKALANRKKGFHCSEYVYQTASELTVERILDAVSAVPECPQKFL